MTATLSPATAEDQDRDGLARCGAIVGIAVSLVSVFYTYKQVSFAEQQTRISNDALVLAREANDRQAGRTPAQLRWVDTDPNPNTLPDDLRKRVFDRPFHTAFLDSPEKLLRLNTRIVLENVGPQPIDAIKVNTECDFAGSRSDLFKTSGSDDGPIIMEQTFPETYDLTHKFDAKQVARLSLTKGLLHQMLQAQRGRNANEEVFGQFNIRCSGRIVGSTAFDPMQEDRVLKVRLLWLPSGFDEAKCRRILDEYKPKAEIMSFGRLR